MRYLVNILIGLMLVGLLAGGVWVTRTEKERTQEFDETRMALQRFQQQIAIRSALRDVPVSKRGYPMTINPEWFADGLPQNLLLGRSHPWLEIAHEDDHEREHPSDPVATNRNQALFWYNPHTGHVRARVPQAASEAATMELYNRVNGTSLRRW